MSNQQLRDYTVYLDGIAPQQIPQRGTHFHIQKATADVVLNFDNNNKMIRQQGQGADIPDGFERVELSSATPQTVVITLGTGKSRDARASATIANVSTTIESANKNTQLPIVNCAAGVATLLAAANTNRKSLRLMVDSEQVGGVFLGGVGIAAGQGGFIEQGMVEYMDTEGALYAFNSNAADVTVSVLELERL